KTTREQLQSRQRKLPKNKKFLRNLLENTSKPNEENYQRTPTRRRKLSNSFKSDENTRERPKTRRSKLSNSFKFEENTREQLQNRQRGLSYNSSKSGEKTNRNEA
ncbi:32310_t:CDS:1, partial [Gigaspora margarita]